jgi:hypothetical protein
MKIKITCLFFLYLPFIVLFNQASAQKNRVTIQVQPALSQLLYASEQIRQAAEKTKAEVTQSITISKTAVGEILVKIIADSALCVSIAKEEQLSLPAYFGWQCYAIRVKQSGKQKIIYVLAGDKAGAMYGGLDVASAFLSGIISKIADSDNRPYLDRRGIKFNIPLDLRTPSYTDPGDAAQQNIPNVWEKSFWKSYLDEMVLNRYNVLTLWSLHPFPSMVKIPEFPEVALKDVWRTKEKFDDGYSHMGVNFVRPNLLKNVEVLKQMSIDEKILFWKEVMQMASDRGIEIYVFTWNIFTNGAEGKHGITSSQENDTTIAYFRASVREMITTYPLLAGIGITSGENMNPKLTGENANEKWLWKTYGEGIRDGLKNQPGRKFTLVHRFHWASLGEIQKEFKDLPCKLDLSLKYAIAHMYSITNPPFIYPAMPLLSPQTKSWLTIRNDDIYSFRWANNNFARQFIKQIPEPEKIAGYYMGPDGYTWGRDYLTLGKEHPLILQKQWYSFMLWGRLGYNPDLPDEVFFSALQTHFPSADIKKLYKPWSSASMIFPWITRYVWGDIDLKWFPEANISHPTSKGFYTVADYIEREPMPGSNIRNIYLWAKYQHEGRNDSLQSPLAVADTLTRLSTEALSGLKLLPARKPGSFSELDQTLGDIEAFAHIGNYYAAKMKAACSLALFDQFANEADKTKAVAYLREAKKHWALYAKLYSSLYKPALYNRVGYVDIPALLVKTDADIKMAEQWKPGTIKYQVKITTEQPFRN